MADEKNTEQDQQDQNPAKVPGEGDKPAPQNPMDDHGTGGDTDGSEAVGDGPSGGAPTGDTGGTGGEATGDGPSGGA